MLEQRGDHACSEWNDQGCLFGGRSERNDCGGILLLAGVRLLQRCAWLQQPDHSGIHWVELFFFFFRSSIVWRWKVNVAWCVSTSYNDSQCIATSPLELLFFISFLTQIFFFYFSFDATYYIAFHTLVAPAKHHVQFSLMLHVTIILVCFTLVVPSLCILPIFWLSC